MAQDTCIRIHDETASEYDREAETSEYYAHEALFGMMFSRLQPGKRIADLGIGTGLCAQVFADYGLVVHGFDGSSSMLTICREKQIATSLHQVDLRNLPLEVKPASFDHVIACGLFHFFADLRPLIEETTRILVPGGMFGFNVVCPPNDKPVRGSGPSNVLETMSPWNVPIFQHPYNHAMDLLETYGLEPLKRMRVLLHAGEGEDSDLFSAVYLTRLLT